MKVDGKLMAKARCKGTDLHKANTGFDTQHKHFIDVFLQTSFFEHLYVVFSFKKRVCEDMRKVLTYLIVKNIIFLSFL